MIPALPLLVESHILARMPTLALNKRASHDYTFLQKFEGGLVLTGPEVKSAKKGQIQLQGAFVTVHNEELWLTNSLIAKYGPAGEQPQYDPRRSRKVLVHKKQIRELIGKSQQQGLTIVPISVYTRGSLVKIEFALARGKKQYEKREKIKKREIERELRGRMKE